MKNEKDKKINYNQNLLEEEKKFEDSHYLSSDFNAMEKLLEDEDLPKPKNFLKENKEYLDSKGKPIPCPMCGEKMINRLNQSMNTNFVGCSNYPDCKFTISVGSVSKNFLFLEEIKNDFKNEKSNLLILRLFHEIGALEGNTKFNKRDNFYIRLRRCVEIFYFLLEKILTSQIYNLKTPTPMINKFTNAPMIESKYFQDMLNLIKKNIFSKLRDEYSLEEAISKMEEYSKILYKNGSKGAHINRENPFADMELSKNQKMDYLRKLQTLLTIPYFLVEAKIKYKKIPFSEKLYQTEK